MTFSIWLEPSQQDAKHLRKIIKHLAKKHDAPTFAPHVTLHSGIKRYRDAENAVRNCTAFSKLHLETKGIRYSDYLWKTLFAEIKKDDYVKQLNKCLKNSLERQVKYEFKPHLSLIYKKLDANTKRKLVRTMNVKRHVVFDKITIIVSSKNVKAWKKKKTIYLKKPTTIRS
jgi:2'-5' RNA ligase